MQDTVLNSKEYKENLDKLYEKVSGHINAARSKIMRAIDTEQVKAYWLIGRDIIEEEQIGNERAEYGKNIAKELSVRLQKEFGKGFSLSNIKNFRQFYLTFRLSEKSYAVRSQLEAPKFKSNLGWTHYRTLMRIEKEDVRGFYEAEASKNNWSSRELDRQIGSLLYQRLALSKDKKGLLKLAQEGQEIKTPEDAIKDPYVLEFLNIPASHKLVESKLEAALITHLQKFLLELGRGFAYRTARKIDDRW